jgi:hypothetical protein
MVKHLYYIKKITFICLLFIPYSLFSKDICKTNNNVYRRNEYNKCRIKNLNAGYKKQYRSSVGYWNELKSKKITHKRIQTNPNNRTYCYQRIPRRSDFHLVKVITEKGTYLF